VYDGTGKTVQKFGDDLFKLPFWCDMVMHDDRRLGLNVVHHVWRCRGLAGQSFLPVNEAAGLNYLLSISDGTIERETPGARSYHPLATFPLRHKLELVFEGDSNGIVRCRDVGDTKVTWTVDLNKRVPKSLKPWLANARATPIEKGVWQLPGGRVESDLGGQ